MIVGAQTQNLIIVAAAAIIVWMSFMLWWNLRNHGLRGFTGLNPDVLQSPSGQFLFRRPLPSDVDDVVKLAIQPHSMLANGWTEETAAQHEQTLRTKGFSNFAKVALLATTTTGEVIGVASLTMREGSNQDLAIGIHVSADHQGKGVATELMAAMIMAVRDGPFDGQAWVGTATTNAGMQRVMEHLGYRPEPGEEPYTAPNGQTFPSVWYVVGPPAPLPRLRSGRS